MKFEDVKKIVVAKKNKILFTASMTAASVLTPVVAFAAESGTVDLSSTVDTGISLLDKGYTFITEHALIFATVALSIAFKVVYGMKGAFRR